MKLATLKQGQAVALNGDKAIPLNELGYTGSLIELIKNDDTVVEDIKNKLKEVGNSGQAFEPKELGAPVTQPSKIVAIGLNYMDHASESEMEVPETPLVFTKFPNAITGPTNEVEIPTELTQEVDYEVELGIVIGKKAKNVSKEQAMEHVFGYTVVNDISARDLQFSDEQWVRGKSLDTFCPMGPVIVTKDELSNPQQLGLECAINGETLQKDNTKNMIFDVADLVSRLSHSFTLEAGDIIASGTPQGVGFSRKPPIYVTPGDTVRTWIEGIGELVNPVVEV